MLISDVAEINHNSLFTAMIPIYESFGKTHFKFDSSPVSLCSHVPSLVLINLCDNPTWWRGGKTMTRKTLSISNNVIIYRLCWNLLIRPLASRMCFGKQTVSPSIYFQRKAYYNIRQPFSCYYTSTTSKGFR